MLFALFGNQTVQKILIFLFVNGKCHGTKLKRLLGLSLTPVQKALERLEKGGIVMSYCEGKTRVFLLNPAYPLAEELEQLLKKAYCLLTPEEKMRYYAGKENLLQQNGQAASKPRILQALWDRLKQVKTVTFLATPQSKKETGWNGKGVGEVIVTNEKKHVLVFHEKGIWKGKKSDEMAFSNVFRWTLDQTAGVISLEHLRRGADQPVFLFSLAPSGNASLTSVDSHLCGGDVYFGQIFFNRQTLRLNWRVIGPKKNEEIEYYYL